MKKNNEKGFLLAEAIVVGVFVLSLFVFLFVNVVPLVGRYEGYENYDTIDGVYNANMVRAMIMEDNNMNTILKLGSGTYKVYTATSLCNSLVKKNYCKILLGKNFLNVKKIYIKYAARDYINSLDDFSQPSGSTYRNYHRIIIQYNDDSFANIEVKVSES